MTGMGQDALDDAVARHDDAGRVDALPSKKRGMMKSSFSCRRALAARVEAAVVQHEDPSFRTCC